MIGASRIAPVLALALALAATGCGYSTESLMPAGVDRMAVDVFENDTFYREIEFGLTRELTGELRQRTRVAVVTRSHADAVLTGRITSVGRPTLVTSPRDLVSEQGVILTARVSLTDPRDGREIAGFIVRNRAEFVVERGETLESAFAEASRDLAEQIVDRLEDASFRRQLDALRTGRGDG
ncbi:MAG: LptE family protein [Planctomycetota bacterium]